MIGHEPTSAKVRCRLAPANHGKQRALGGEDVAALCSCARPPPHRVLDSCVDLVPLLAYSACCGVEISTKGERERVPGIIRGVQLFELGSLNQLYWSCIKCEVTGACPWRNHMMWHIVRGTTLTGVVGTPNTLNISLS